MTGFCINLAPGAQNLATFGHFVSPIGSLLFSSCRKYFTLLVEYTFICLSMNSSIAINAFTPWKLSIYQKATRHPTRNRRGVMRLIVLPTPSTNYRMRQGAL